MGFDFREFKELRDKFVKMDKEWDEFLSKFLLEMGLRTLVLTKDNHPVDTGLMRAMWQLGDSKNVVRFNGNSKHHKSTLKTLQEVRGYCK